MTTVSAACIAGAMAFVGGGTADAAQGCVGCGKAWFKVARSELLNSNTQTACESTGVSKWNWQPMVAAVNSELVTRKLRATGRSSS